MTLPTPVAGPTAAAAPAVGAGRLAWLLQEPLTAAARVRSNRQAVHDAAAFREQMLQLFRRADHDATVAGFEHAMVRLAVFAVVALVDESALGSTQPAFAEWARRPMQQELFGGLMAGEWFFQHVDELLAAPDSPHLADVLEVYGLCLLLGFRGRYGADTVSLSTVTSRISDRVARIRGPQPADLVPGWRPPRDVVSRRDPWVRRLAIGLVAAVVLAALVWGVGTISLRAGQRDIAGLARSTAAL
jgi:type VI secretion system protein ImpK